ncbi:hypothetical protein KP509_28G029200 [Ceratopteris richardii]|uniref:PUM-HD domain-containing protein n=1 Tax=Ceratopteris richardii TaxID=49495 RepID=A0A8T2RAT0_CERRI|nr:hypothetical protein KP509_28G029200 [Ceratopteris richardii]KAH7293516.1 hypothetical protein KP509_28G029200 [Ceratopteris richardii]KAH7293517.1 hypothetical protein KP509_28G029200 [Ceratopteris richardii]KAH7293518.1 hypothetical protein KP509_28G029200 [Ceratopteris richardii]KAH7293519.1 hypothetical protein KP509_28G029200 [Ceratopteris richardii]
MATEDPMQLLGTNGVRGVLGMTSSGRSPSNMGLTTPSAQDSVAEELDMLLRSHTHLDNLISRKEPGSYRSGSAPPTMEGSLLSGGGTFPNYHAGGVMSDKNDIDTEKELRADPAYLVYYYSHVNLNPRLPPPIVTRENYHLAQRLARDKRNLKFFDDSNNKSLFSAQPMLPTHNEEPEFSEDEKSSMGDLLKQLQIEQANSRENFFTVPHGMRPKSLVDLIQEDFPRTPSPVFTQMRPPSRVANDDGSSGVSGLDGQVPHLRESSASAATVSELNTVLLGSRSATPNPVLGSRSATPNSILSSVSVSGNTVGATSGSSTAGGMTKGSLKPGMNTVAVAELASSLKSLGLTDRQRLHTQQEHGDDFSLQQHQVPPSQIPHAPQNQPQKLSELDSNNRTQGKYSPTHSQSSFGSSQPCGTSNMYAAAANVMSYMAANPYYQNLHSFSPQFNGFPVNPSLVPAMMANYPSSMPHDTAAAAAAAAMASGMGLRAPLSPNNVGLDMQHLYKYPGQGLSPLSSQISDQLYYNYLQQYFGEDGRSDLKRMDSSLLRGYQMEPMETQKNHSSALFGYPTDNKSPFSRGSPFGTPSGSKNGSLSPGYYGSPPGVGLTLPYGTSPMSSPVLPGSPLLPGGFSLRQGECNFRFPGNTNRVPSGGSYMGWPGQKTGDLREEFKATSLLEELKNNKARRFELSDILGNVVEFSADQHGSRFIQQKLETVPLDEKSAVFEEVLPHALTLMTDVFGNYVIQKFFEHGSPSQRSELAEKLVGHVLSLSLQMYGCRVIQKALEVVDVNQQIQLISELDGQVMRCVKDQNGNHVIQKCIECVPPEHINFILASFRGQVVMLSTHPYGCRVIQRVLEHCTEEQKQDGIMEEILHSVCILAQDQYGNYVVQHILEHGKPEERSEILTKMAGQIVQMSQHKFASNVVEKCLEFSGPTERQILITEMLGHTDENEPLQAMMKDQFANYVVQKVLEICDDQQREMLLSRIRVHLHALKKYTYGKHIVARVEKLIAAGERRGSLASSIQ